ncbi:MAG: hypothetical protein GY888_29715 [Planctomycetaceae bacterium]|nr:hypothetical protein [Planctomycetaceae bacterium]
MEHIFVVDNVDELQGIMPGSAEYVQLAGHAHPGDGGEGLFRWTEGAAVANNGTVISSRESKTGYWHRMYSGAVSVRWFGARGDGTDVTQQMQAAIDVAIAGGTVLVPTGTYRVKQPLKLHQGVALIGDGLLSVIHYDGPAGTGCLQSDQPTRGQAFHLARFNIEVHTEGAYGVDLRGMSYSRFDDLHMHLRAEKTSGFYGPGNMVSPYYNLFTACHVAGTANLKTNGCTGFNFTFDEQNQYQAANSNSIMGGRISTCQVAVRCMGTGNMFYGQVLESDQVGYEFDVPPGRLKDEQLGISNDIIGCYCEYVAKVIVQKHGSCYLNALLTMVTGYEQVFEAVNTKNCIVITSHDGSLPTSRSMVDRRIDFKQLVPPQDP